MKKEILEYKKQIDYSNYIEKDFNNLLQNEDTKKRYSLLKEKVNDNYIIELDRKIAIKKGIEELTNNDILLILGKGHENYQIIGSNKTHFSDKETVQEIIKNI